MLKDTLAARLAEITQAGLLRRRRVLESPQGASVRLEGRTIVNFCGNDYLGLASHPRVAEALQKGAERWGAGSGASHLVCGHSAAHHALEEALAAFTGRERALLFSTGYMANQGVITALVGRGDTVFEDRLNHASLLDGGLLSAAHFQRYLHGDAASLRSKLAERGAGQALVVTDGVFSMDGDLAPLPELAAAAQGHGAWLMVDDAHGFGVLGAQGGGCLEHFGLSTGEVPILVGTLGKALGTFGAFVAGDAELIEYLIQKARSYIYTTALPPAVAEATRASLALLSEEPWRRERLQALIRRFRAGAESLGLKLHASFTPIQPLILGDNRRAVAASDWLLQRGFWIGAIRPPTVPEGTARLRLTLSAAHEDAHLDALLDALGACPELRQ
ncbi:MAG TPA: 8-amino-7-oxononanoate synthase [Methylococcaceae bacterium]|nr:8-amino-7-oxononanoate synthase [Methylococcaceae bacterium]